MKFNCNTLLLVNCATASNGYDEFCYCDTCSENEGDCDAHDECLDVLACGSNNCPAFQGFEFEIDCCYQPTIGDEHFCTNGIPCGEDEGDCDSNTECQAGLTCGSNNCPDSLGFDIEIDCCYEPSLGDVQFCSSGIIFCGQDEGDCDSNSECLSNHFCGSNNCPASLDFDYEIDCCSSTQMMSPNYPNSYPKNVYETWLLTAPTGLVINLQFHSFHVRLLAVKSKIRSKYQFMFFFHRLTLF